MKMKKKKVSVLKITIVLMVINLISKFVGMLREVFLAKYYGASMYTDAYIIANNIPIIIFGVMGTALSSTFIPIYSEINSKDKDGKLALNFINNVLSLVMIFCGIIAIIGEVFTKETVLIFAKGFEGEILDYSIQFSKILMPCIFAIAIMNVFVGFLQISGRYTVISSVTIPCNLIIVISLMLSYKFDNIYIMILGTLFGNITQVVYLYPFAKSVILFFPLLVRTFSFHKAWS